MNKENWKKIELIYDQALLLDKEKQGEFVKLQADSDSDIYHQVLKMLNTDADGFMQSFPEDIASLHEFETADPTKLGDFKILKKIATGGMGRVYLAQSTRSDVVIKVALKTIRIELINEELKQRFQNEKNILSKLQHKNIASLIDAGVTETQIPYIATEWVNGKNIKEYCIENNLSIKQRLNLFLQICDAMVFAHNKLIIHRDLKPDNILVNNHQQVKLLDFGIAKIVDENQNNQTQTQIFTPDYAAPEQLSGDMCTAATDIYSLGVILFEMLTNSKRFNLAGLAIAEKIKAMALPKLADLSDVQPEHKLVYSVSHLKGTLYTIINKAMHVEPSRRYNSVSAFVTDIENYQENRPIKAMNDSVFYKTKMLLLRNKLASSFLLLAFVGITSGLIIAKKQLILKDREAKKSLLMLDFFDTVLIEASPVEGGSLNITVREMFEKGLGKFDINKIKNSYIKAEIASNIALIYSQLGQNDKSIKLYQIAVDYYGENLSEGFNASAYLQNKMQIANKLISENDNKAKFYIEESLNEVKNYSVNPNQLGLAYIYLARIHGRTGSSFNKIKAFEYYDKAESIVTEISDNNNKKHSLLGEIYFYKQENFYATNTYSEALEYLNKAEFHFEKSLKSDYNPNLLAVMKTKAGLLSKYGQLEKAINVSSEALERGFKTHSTKDYIGLINQAGIYLKMGKFNNALTNLNQAEEIYKLSGKTKNLNYYGLLLNKTNALIGLEQYQQVQTNLDDIIEFMRNLLPADHYIIKVVVNDQATFYLKSNNTSGIIQSKTSLIEYLELDNKQTPLDKSVQFSTLINLANIYLFEKKYNTAYKYYQKANEITIGKVDEYNQSWLYWQLQTGLEISKLDLKITDNTDKFILAKKQLLKRVGTNNWFDSFFSIKQSY